MKKSYLPKFLLLSVLVAGLVSYNVILDINSDPSSTAAIGYLFVPFIFGFIFLFTLGVLLALKRILSIFRGERNIRTSGSILAFMFLLITISLGLIYYDITLASSPSRTWEQIDSASERYKNIPILRSMMLGSILLHPNPPVAILESEIQNSNYQAAKNPGIPTESLEKLIREIPGDNWGILCNLAAHKNLNQTGMQLLVEKADGNFETTENLESYKDCVFRQLRFHPNVSDRLKEGLKGY